MTGLYKIWHVNAERVCQVHRPLKKLISKIQDGGQPPSWILGITCLRVYSSHSGVHIGPISVQLVCCEMPSVL